MSCEACDSCETCEGCDSCVTCQTCNESCNGPEEGCLTCEGFCQIDQTVSSWAGEFEWKEPVSSNSLFFSRSTWNKIIEYINKARAAGDSENGATSGLSALEEDDNVYMTANKFNEVATALFNLGGNDSDYSQRTVYAVGSKEKPEGDIVYGSYFEELEDQVNHLQYKSDQCNSCNTACDDCDSCEGCDDCQSGNTSYSSSKTCDDDPEEGT